MDRDLARVDLWEESLRRSRDRRERVAAQPPFELPARGVSVTAALALAGVPAVAIGATKALSGGDDATAVAKPASKRVAHETGQTPSVRPTQISAPAVVKSSSSSTTTTTVASVARRGGGVVELQRKLGVPADGDFGPRTERALKRWQRAHKLTADGIAGPQTRAALGLGAGEVLKRKRAAGKRRAGGSRRASGARRFGGSSRPRASRSGGGVSALQAALGIGADGVFGPATERALKRWQRGHGLTADGIAGPQTRAALGIGPGKVLKRRRAGGGSSGGGGGGGSVGSSTVQRVIAAANRIASSPYKYGGGHGSFTDSGYDCSGSVSYALHGGGLLSSPIDSGAFMSYGAPGPGQRITIYANPGHVYMTIDGRRFDTSARSETGSRWTGTQRSTAGYTVRHPRGL